MKKERSSGLLASTVNPTPNIQEKFGQRNSIPSWSLAVGGNRPFNLPRSDITWAKEKRKVNWSGIDGHIGRNPDSPVLLHDVAWRTSRLWLLRQYMSISESVKRKAHAASMIFLFPSTNVIDICSVISFPITVSAQFPYLTTKVIGNNSLAIEHAMLLKPHSYYDGINKFRAFYHYIRLYVTTFRDIKYRLERRTFIYAICLPFTK